MQYSKVIIKLLVNIIPLISITFVIVGAKLFKRTEENKINYFSILMFCIAIYTFGYFLELNSIYSNTLILIRDFEYLGAIFIPAFGILFISQITKIKIRVWLKIILYSISSILWILFITNEYHLLFFKSINLVKYDFSEVISEKGIAFYLLLAYYAAAFIFSGILLLIAFKREEDKTKKKSFYFWLITFPIPLSAIFYISMRINAYIDFVPAVIMVSCIILNFNEINKEMYEIKIKKWKNTFSDIWKPAFLTDSKGKIVCKNQYANILLATFGNCAEDFVKRLDENESNLKPIFFTVNNEKKWFDIKKNDFDIKNKLTSYLLVDITNKKSEHQELRISEEKYRLLITQMQQGLAIGEVILDADNKVIDYYVVDINDKFTEITGLKRETVIGKKASEIIPHADFKWTQRYGEVAMSGKSYKYEEYSYDCGKFLEVVVYSPQPMQFAMIISDISERKRAEEAIKEGEEQYRLIMGNVNDMISKHSIDGKYTFLSKSCKDILGYEPEELIGVSPYDLIHPQSIDYIRESHSKSLNFRGVDISTYKIRHKLGYYVWLETSNNTIWDDNGKPKEILCVSRDVTKKMREENFFKHLVTFAEELLGTGSENITYERIINNLMYISRAKYGALTLLDENSGKYATVAVAGISEQMGKLSKLLGFNLVGKTWEDYNKENNIVQNNITHYSSLKELAGKVLPENLYNSIEKLLNTGEVVVVRIIVNNKLMGDFTLVMQKDRKFENQHLIEIYSRQIEMYLTRKEAEKEVYFLSYHDLLTGLYTRSYYEKALMRMDTQEKLPLTLIMVDVNGLKLTNDAFGHKAGDMLLRQVAGVLKNECRENDLVARIGGDEFVILLPKTDEILANQLIERINLAITSKKTDNFILSVSIGFAVKKDACENIDEIFKEAEDEMYRHKLSESSSMRSNTIGLIMNSLYEKNDREMMHSLRVSEICEEIAVKMKFPKNDIQKIKIAGLMHDIGKIAISEKILDKPTILDTAEYNEIKRHSEIGYRILSSVNEFSKIADYVLEHHERWDGKGYPKGLKGEEISIEARIIAIADVFDAMTSKRPYRKAMSEEEAIKKIIENSGSQFDPKIVNIFTQKILNDNIRQASLSI